MLIRPILNFLFPNAPEEMLQLYHVYVRKAAHFTEYAVLAGLALRAFVRASTSMIRGWMYLAAIFVVVAVASIDEFNQSFNAARTGSGYDVLLDISGGATVLVLIWLFNRPSRKNSDPVA